MQKYRYDVSFSGTVQGVGFRFTTQQIATGFSVNGFVQNLPDGSVKLVCEGEQSELDALLEALQIQMGEYISDTNISKSDATGEFSEFHIRG